MVAGTCRAHRSGSGLMGRSQPETLTFDSFRALRQEPSAIHTAIRIANNLNADKIAASAVARNNSPYCGMRSNAVSCR